MNYDSESEDDSSSALDSIASSLIDSGTQLAQSYLNNSNIAAQPLTFQTIPISPAPAQSSSIVMLVLVLAVGFILYKVFTR